MADAVTKRKTAQNAQGGDTSQRLLDAACKVFAQRGYRDATVGEICRKARANIAAVNYHFGSKKSLYKESWRYAHGNRLRMFPPDGGVSASAGPQERLRGRVRAMLSGAVFSDGLEFRIVDHEIANPTGLLKEVFNLAIRPLSQAMAGIVGQLLGPKADQRSIRLCVLSVIGPIMQIMRRLKLHPNDGPRPLLRADGLDEMVEHFTTFAVAGIEATRRRIANRRSATQQQQSKAGKVIVRSV